MPKELEPFFIHIPSVRSSIISCISRWYVHAIEIKAGNDIAREIEEKILLQKDPLVKEALGRISKSISQRAFEGDTEFPHEIHFVVADNAALFQEKKIHETHTPSAVQLARVLNFVGNSHGVFVHYITPEEMRHIFPLSKRRISPFAHYNEIKRQKTGPGEATNVALAYIRGFQEQRKEKNSKVFLLRMSDDTVPPLTAVRENDTGKRNFRNFFSDQLEIIRGKEVKKTYRGYHDSTNERKRFKTTRPAVFILRYGNINDFPFYSTFKNEDFHYSSGKNTRTFCTPPYLHHLGKSTWYNRDNESFFGKWDRGGYEKIRPVRTEFLQTVLENSEVKMQPKKKKASLIRRALSFRFRR